MYKIILGILPFVLIVMTSFLETSEIQRVEHYDLIKTDNPHYKIIENQGKKYYIYNYVHVGKIHERRFVSGNEVFYFIRKFHQYSSTIELIDENNQTIFHGFTSANESNLYFGKNDRYEKITQSQGISIYKNDRLILSTEFIHDKSFGNRINLEYNSTDANMKFLKLLAIESTIRNYENIPPVIFPGKQIIEAEKAHNSRYN